MRNNLLTDLNEEQQKVMKATHGPVLVLAGAGSGKTRALTYRIAYLLQQKIAQPEEILAVTFTNKAAGEMKERVRKLVGKEMRVPTAISTFHSLGARILREQARFLPRSRGFTVCDTGDSERLIRKSLEELNLSKKEYSPRQMRGRISSLKNKMLTSDDEVTAAIWARYEKLLARNDAYDFDDLLIETFKLIEKNKQIRESYQRRWQFISVDEYQDTNPLQDNLLKLLAGEKKNVCVVGDDYQAIYSWRGAKIDHILDFEKTYPGCQTIYLTRNYRSTPQILAGANKVIAENKGQKHKKLWTKRGEGEEIKILSFESNRKEAQWVQEEIENLAAGGEKRGDCVVLYRTNAQSRILEEEFIKHQMPYTIVGGWRFYERREVKDALAFLNLWVNPNSLLSIERLADVLWRGVGPKTIAAWNEQAEKEGVSLAEIIRQKADSLPAVEKTVRAFDLAKKKDFTVVADLLKFLLEKSGYWRWLKQQADGEERLKRQLYLLI
jgi:DNA helicase-2/ATP-dependent DNA helicase PcrA